MTEILWFTVWINPRSVNSCFRLSAVFIMNFLNTTSLRNLKQIQIYQQAPAHFFFPSQLVQTFFVFLFLCASYLRKRERKKHYHSNDYYNSRICWRAYRLEVKYRLNLIFKGTRMQPIVIIHNRVTTASSFVLLKKKHKKELYYFDKNIII